VIFKSQNSGFEGQNFKIKSADSGFQAKLADYLFILAWIVSALAFFSNPKRRQRCK
jgi:hypothetical protein